MADVGASKEMLLHQLNALMADAAGDAETMELYQAKLAELTRLGGRTRTSNNSS